MADHPRLIRPLNGSMAATGDERILEVIFGVVGACEGCMPRRVAATTVIKTRAVGRAIIECCGETEPFDSNLVYCDSCVADYLDPDASDPRPEWAIELVSVERLA